MPGKKKGFNRKTQSDAQVVNALWYDEVSTIVIEYFKAAMKWEKENHCHVSTIVCIAYASEELCRHSKVNDKELN